jgi:hypothetical protein
MTTSIRPINHQDLLLAHFSTHCEAGKKLFQRKNSEYGDAFEVYGLLGVVCELLGACARLPQLVLWSPGHGEDKQHVLLDILTDIHNFAVMALICIDKDNWDGRNHE